MPHTTAQSQTRLSFQCSGNDSSTKEFSFAFKKFANAAGEQWRLPHALRTMSESSRRGPLLFVPEPEPFRREPEPTRPEPELFQAAVAAWSLSDAGSFPDEPAVPLEAAASGSPSAGLENGLCAGRRHGRRPDPFFPMASCPIKTALPWIGITNRRNKFICLPLCQAYNNHVVVG